MEDFQKFVLYFAIFLLIITLVIVGVALSKASNNVAWPPMTPACPDYWTMDVSGNCVNVKDLGSCQTVGSNHQTMDFSNSFFTGSQGVCNKYNWAKKCNVTWDGVTYGVSPPSCSA